MYFIVSSGTKDQNESHLCNLSVFCKTCVHCNYQQQVLGEESTLH